MIRTIFLLLLVTCSRWAVSQMVYKTPSGEKYHLATCRMVKNVSQALDLSTALAQGLRPCNICHPQTLPSGGWKAKAQGEKKKTTQCLGFTKAGSRCQHMTSIANGYCYQHQPK